VLGFAYIFLTVLRISVSGIKQCHCPATNQILFSGKSVP
jgi:hypothetical protein